MQALVKSRAEPGLWLEEVPVPEIGIDDVLIRILKTSICGTDVHILQLGCVVAEDDSGTDGNRP